MLRFDSIAGLPAATGRGVGAVSSAGAGERQIDQRQ